MYLRKPIIKQSGSIDMNKARVYIGTSGWNYKHWENRFYPSTLKKKDQMAYFSAKFKTVELNNSFYRQPKAQNFIQWAQQVPTGFIYAVKANRYFTHLKKLKVTEEDVQVFLDAASNLEDKLGPILFQLPPKWKLNLERLELFLRILPKPLRYTIEFRDHSWYDEQVYTLLKQYNCAFCIYELDGHQSPIMATADFVYIRLHGPGKKYQGSYTTETLNIWKENIEMWVEDRKDVYLYFDNDQDAYAAQNALTLIDMLTHKNM